MSGNHGGNGGGGIAAEGIANVIGSLVDDNSAGGAVGGGVFDVSLIRRSTISGNQASSGGGVEAFPGLNMTITTLTLDGNHATAYGGAIDESGLVKITRSTLAANTAGGRFLGSGAAVELQGGAELRLSDSTLAGNGTRPAGGGAIDNYGGLAELSFDTFAGNSGSLTGSSYSTATGTILATDGSEPNCQVPLHETAVRQPVHRHLLRPVPADRPDRGRPAARAAGRPWGTDSDGGAAARQPGHRRRRPARDLGMPAA